MGDIVMDIAQIADWFCLWFGRSVLFLCVMCLACFLIESIVGLFRRSN